MSKIATCTSTIKRWRSHFPRRSMGLLLAMVLLLAACGGGAEEAAEAPAADPTPTYTPLPAPTNTPEPTATPEPTEEPVQEESPLATPDDRGLAESPLATPEGRSAESPLATPESEGETMPDDDILARLIERAQEQLNEETGVAVEEITVVESEAVEWPDASLGCPDPDAMYAQVLTPGYRIVLEADGETYAFHSDTDPEGQLILCDGL